MKPVERIKRMLEPDEQIRARYAVKKTHPDIKRQESDTFEDVLGLFDPGVAVAAQES